MKIVDINYFFSAGFFSPGGSHILLVLERGHMLFLYHILIGDNFEKGGEYSLDSPGVVYPEEIVKIRAEVHFDHF